MTTEIIKPLEESFARDGFQHKLVERNGEWAIYKLWKPNHGTRHYEVVRIAILPPYTSPEGKSLPTREVYPKSESWGTDGFTCDSLERACERMQEMLAKPKKGKK